MKSTLLLATALFLISAPEPDSKTMAELSAGFLSATNKHKLVAAEPASNAKSNAATRCETDGQYC